MIQVHQTLFGGFEEKPPGNCLQAAVASILELPLEGVPHFLSFRSAWWDKFCEFLAAHQIVPCRLEPTANMQGKGYHLITGISPRSPVEAVRYHSVVGCDGTPVHDPYPGGNCELREIMHFTIFLPLE